MQLNNVTWTIDTQHNITKQLDVGRFLKKEITIKKDYDEL